MQSKTVELWEPDHAREVGHSSFRPLHCNGWGESRWSSEFWVHIYALSILMNSQLLRSARERCIVGNLVVNHLIFADVYVCLVLASMVLDAFWIFVVATLLNVKLSSIVKRQSVKFSPSFLPEWRGF